MFQRPEDRMTEVAAAERQRTKAVAEHRRQSAATSRQGGAVVSGHSFVQGGVHVLENDFSIGRKYSKRGTYM